MALAPTRLLYHADSFLRSFTARVVGHAAWHGRPSVVLDATAFYPEAGGQLGDQGELGGVAIVDVQIDDAGVVHHVLADAAAPPAIDVEVAGAIEWARRRIHMAQHTGQHMLSAALLEVADAATVSSRLGDGTCTIDVARDPVPDRAIAAAEDLANAVIDDDVAIRAWFPSADELAALALRREPKVERDVRVIEIGGFDRSPCGGTHCARTAQVGQLRVTGTERYKGMTRVHFAAGRRARALLASHSAVLVELARGFSCGATDVPAAIDKLRRDLLAAGASLRDVRGRLAEALAAGLLAGPDTRIVAVIPDGDTELLRTLASRLTEAGRDALLAAPGADGTAVLLARADGSTFDCGATLRALASAAGGRGGGRPDRAEGRLPAGIDWVALAQAHA